MLKNAGTWRQLFAALAVTWFSGIRARLLKRWTAFYHDSYREVYGAPEGLPTPEHIQVAEKLALARARAISPFIRNRTGDVLEVGTGIGAFLAVMHRKAWNTLGLEPGDKFRSWANENYPIDVIGDEFEEFARSTSQRFDLVCMWHVLEHLRDPVDALKLVHRLLTPGGLIAFEVPNANWYRYHGAPVPASGLQIAHLFEFSDETLSLLVAKAGGWEFLGLATHDHGQTGPIRRTVRRIRALSIRVMGGRDTNTMRYTMAERVSALAVLLEYPARLIDVPLRMYFSKTGRGAYLSGVLKRIE